MIRVLIFMALAVPALISCAPVASSIAAGQVVPPLAAGSRAAVLADALALADVAARTGDDAALAQRVAMIRSMGARPLDDAASAVHDAWQTQAPDTGPPLRGRTLGPGYRHGTLGAGDDLKIEQTFLSGQKASIALSSPGGSKLGLQVLDGAAQPVCQYTAPRPNCEWIPVFTQRHVIRLTNPGQQKVRFYLVIE